MNDADKTEESNAPSEKYRPLHIVGGFLVGVIGAGVLFVVSILAGMAASNSPGPSSLTVSAPYAGLLSVVWVLAFRRKQSGFAIGVLIATSLAVLLDATCAVMFMR
jgi:hypothetical protein